MEDVIASYHVNVIGVFYTAVAFLLYAANQVRPSRSNTAPTNNRNIIYSSLPPQAQRKL